MAVLAIKTLTLSLTGLQPATTPFLCWQVLAVLAVLATIWALKRSLFILSTLMHTQALHPTAVAPQYRFQTLCVLSG